MISVDKVQYVIIINENKILYDSTLACIYLSKIWLHSAQQWLQNQPKNQINHVGVWIDEVKNLLQKHAGKGRVNNCGSGPDKTKVCFL